MQIKKFLKWGSSSLMGHLALVGLPFAIVEFVVGIYLNFVENTLTVSWGFYVAMVCAISGIVAAFFVWYAITLPLIKRMKRKREGITPGVNGAKY